MVAEVFIGSDLQKSAKFIEVLNPYDKRVASKVVVCDEQVANEALIRANETKRVAKNAPLHRRVEWLLDVAKSLEKQKEQFAKAITLESAKPITASRLEVERTVETIKLTAYELINLNGETINTDAMPNGKKTTAYYMYEPVGVVVAITPFNFPLNLVAHKIAPALAVGNTVVLKPAPQTPYCGFLLAKLFIDSPFATKDALSVVYGDSEVGNALVASEIPRKISFTGSVAVGKIITRSAGLKKLSLELGGNSATYIDREADLSFAAKRCAVGAFGNAGQVCISLQRIFVASEIYDEFAKLLAIEAKNLKSGSCFDEDTFVSALIDQHSTDRAKAWIDEATKAGAVVASGGDVLDGVLTPAVLVDVKPDMQVVCEEVFAPIVSLIRVSSADEAFGLINDSPYGLQFSVFTDSLKLATKAIDELECGGVVINDIPTMRFDIQPYGGVKNSGIGREGPKFALKEMCEIKSVVIM